jgi:hypothetical protein
LSLGVGDVRRGYRVIGQRHDWGTSRLGVDVGVFADIGLLVCGSAEVVKERVDMTRRMLGRIKLVLGLLYWRSGAARKKVVEIVVGSIHGFDRDNQRWVLEGGRFQHRAEATAQEAHAVHTRLI